MTLPLFGYCSRIGIARWEFFRKIMKILNRLSGIESQISGIATKCQSRLESRVSDFLCLKHHYYATHLQRRSRQHNRSRHIVVWQRRYGPSPRVPSFRNFEHPFLNIIFKILKYKLSITLHDTLDVTFRADFARTIPAHESAGPFGTKVFPLIDVVRAAGSHPAQSPRSSFGYNNRNITMQIL